MALDRLPHLDDDGLPLPEVGEWAETKYRLIANYAEMFATAMKKKWFRIFIDLFAGAGRARIGGTRIIVPTSAMLALGVRDPFDRYVFCDIDSERISALMERSRRDAPGRQVCYIPGDCNADVARIVAEISGPGSGRETLAFCVADPYGLATLRFSTIRGIASRRVDFLILIPSYMDAHRNLELYLPREKRTIDDFLGDSHWRERWEATRGGGPREFGAFVVDRFGRSMQALKYLYDGPGEEVPVRDSQNHLLYHLAFYSRSELGRKFWREARRYGMDQLNLPFTTEVEKGSR